MVADVPTWAPFRLQFYCNGHSWLARKLTAKGIGHTMADNAFVRIDDWALAQALADTLSPDQLHRTLDRYAKLYCPVSDVFGIAEPNIPDGRFRHAPKCQGYRDRKSAGNSLITGA